MILAEDGRGRDRHPSDLLLLALFCLLPAGILGFKPTYPSTTFLPACSTTWVGFLPDSTFSRVKFFTVLFKHPSMHVYYSSALWRKYLDPHDNLKVSKHQIRFWENHRFSDGWICTPDESLTEAEKCHLLMCEAATCFGGEFDSPKCFMWIACKKVSYRDKGQNFPGCIYVHRKGKTWRLKPAKSSSHLSLALCDLQWEPGTLLLGSAGAELGAEGSRRKRVWGMLTKVRITQDTLQKRAGPVQGQGG